MKKLVLIVALVIGAWYWQHGDIPFVEPVGAFDESGNPVVLMFTIDHCGKACELAREHLLKRKVAFQEILINPRDEGDPNVKLWQRLGGNGFPLIVAGEERIVGSGTTSMVATFLGRNFGDRYLTRNEKKLFRKHFYADGTPRIVMYGADWCPHCKKLRGEFERSGVDYLEIDVDNNDYRERILKTMEISGYPATWVGYTRVNGTTLAAVNRVYQRY